MDRFRGIFKIFLVGVQKFTLRSLELMYIFLKIFLIVFSDSLQINFLYHKHEIQLQYIKQMDKNFSNSTPQSDPLPQNETNSSPIQSSKPIKIHLISPQVTLFPRKFIAQHYNFPSIFPLLQIFGNSSSVSI